MANAMPPSQTIRMRCQTNILNIRAAKDTSTNNNIVGQLQDGDEVTVLVVADVIGRIAWRTVTGGEFAGRFVAERFLNEIYLVEIEEKGGPTLGADVSHFQGAIDWKVMYDHGIRYAFIKATEGTSFTDGFFVRNVTQAKSNNIITGAYHYYRSEDDPTEQAAHFFSIAGNQVDLPLVVDLEATNNPVPPTHEELQEFLQHLEELTEKRPIIYTSPSYWNQLRNPVWSANYPLWIAHHTRVTSPIVPSPWTNWTFWQYTDEANGPTYGVSSAFLDLDRFNGTLQALRDLAGVHVVVPDREGPVRQPLLAPIVRKQAGNQDYYSFDRSGNDEPQLGVNGRRFAFLDVDPQLVPNGSSWAVLLEQLGKADDMNASILRVYAKHKDFSTQQCIDQMRKLLNELNHRVRVTRLLIVLNDSLTGANMYFQEELPYHTGPLGHLSTDYWRDQAYRDHFADFLRTYVPAVMDGFEDLIFGFQIINEPQLTQDPPPTEADTEVFIEGMHKLCELVFNLADGKLPVGTGLRDAFDVCPSPQQTNHLEWTRRIHASPYITFISGNIYQEENSPQWEHRDSHEINIDVAHETQRPFLFTEIGTRHQQQPPGTQREIVLGDFYTWAYVTKRVYACMPWALQFGPDRGFGSALHGLTWEVQGHPVSNTPAAFIENVRWGHNVLPTFG
jgi:lysozyme